MSHERFCHLQSIVVRALKIRKPETKPFEIGHFRGPKPRGYSPIFPEFPPAAPAIPGRLRRFTPQALQRRAGGSGGSVSADECQRVIFDLRRCAPARDRTSVDKPVRNRTFIGPAVWLCSRAALSLEQWLRTVTAEVKLVCSHRDSSSCVPHLACRRLGRCPSAGGKPGLRAGLQNLPVCAV